MEERVIRRGPNRLVYVDGQAFWHWIDSDVLPRFGSLNDLARALAERAGVRPESVQRFFMRWRSRPTIEFFALDRFCTLLDEHVSRFCDLSQFEESA